jgi:hypothetical protein
MHLVLDDTLKTYLDIHKHNSVTWAEAGGRYVTVPELAAQRIALLTGPHWQTILKALDARKRN